jgi:4-amino-4-deoxy-L-arabinose transferase-like glycosyltransferase
MQDRLLRTIRIILWIFAIAVGASQAWVARDTMANDGISYLDMGDAFAHGHAGALINGYWSPLYPASIGAALAVVHPSPRYEFAVVHGVNFAIFLLAMASFEFFLRSLLTVCRDIRGSLPAWFLQMVGYAAFLWSSLYLITVSVASPDMLLAVFVFLSTGILVRIASGSVKWPHFAALGTALGVGYLAKAPLFPLSFVYLTVALTLALRSRVPLRRALLAVLSFVILASPLVLSLSLSKHRLTFGDSGKLNYAWYVDGATYRHWQGEPLGGPVDVAPRWTAGPVSSGVPAHPTRKILDSPPVFEFATPTGGTYPVWYDPSYWNEGLHAPFNLRQQVRKIFTNARFMYSILLNVHVVQLFQNAHQHVLFSTVLIICLLTLVFFGARPRGSSLWLIVVPVMIPGVAALVMYSLVYAEPRHLAPFIALLFTGSFAALGVSARRMPLRIVSGAVVLGFLATGGVGTVRTVYAATRVNASPSEDWQVVEGLRALGIREGARVGSLTYSNHDHVRWARLARAKIVAELFSGAYVTNEDSFWKADQATQTKIIDALSRAGAQIIVSRRLPEGIPPPAGWQRIGETRYFVFRIAHA